MLDSLPVSIETAKTQDLGIQRPDGQGKRLLMVPSEAHVSIDALVRQRGEGQIPEQVDAGGSIDPRIELDRTGILTLNAL